MSTGERAKSRGAKVTVKCQCCKNRFEARVADRKRGWAKFCSKSCKAIRQTQKTGYAGPGRGDYRERDEDSSFVMSRADLAAGGYGDAGPDDPLCDGKW